MRARASALALAVALALAAGASAAAELRTLFHTPEERERLDRMRRGEPPEPPRTQRAAPVVNGFVKRSDGRNTVWIDGKPFAMSDPAAAPFMDPQKVRDAARARAAPPIEIKPSR